MGERRTSTAFTALEVAGWFFSQCDIHEAVYASCAFVLRCGLLFITFERLERAVSEQARAESKSD